MYTKLLPPILVLLLLAMACKEDQTSAASDRVGSTNDGATVPQRDPPSTSQLSVEDDSRETKVCIGSVSTAWCLVADRALERLRIDSEGRWASDAVTYELWVPERAALLAATVLQYDSKHNGYSVAWEPAFIEVEPSEEVSPDVWDEYKWTEGVECTEGPYKVRIDVEDFDPADHKIQWQEGDGDIAKIDGIDVYGVGRAIPVRRIGGVTFWHSGRRFEVPSSLWQDCYDPNISNSIQDVSSLGVKQVDGGVDVEISGADASVGYIVTWHLRTNGNHSREFEFAP